MSKNDDACEWFKAWLTPSILFRDYLSSHYDVLPDGHSPIVLLFSLEIIYCECVECQHSYLPANLLFSLEIINTIIRVPADPNGKPTAFYSL